MANNYVSYNETQTELREDLATLRNYCDKLNLDNTKKSIEDTLDRNKKDSFTVAVIGEFKRGKSTLINALLGKDVLPADILPTSATLNKVVYDTDPHVSIEYKDGTGESVGIDKLADYITKLTAESEAKAATIKESVVYYPTEYCRNNVCIMDTPGLNDSVDMTEVTLKAIPQSDVSIFVIMANSPFSQTEADFLQNKMLVSSVGKIVFAVTGIDRLPEDQRERIVNYIRDRIGKYIIDRAANVYGVDSEEYKNCKNKLGDIKVIGVSGYQALKAKENGNSALLEESNFPEFEDSVSKIVTEERGAITLNVLATKIITSAGELVAAANLRENALKLSKEEFNKKYDEAQVSIKEIRAKRTAEFRKIKESADATYAEAKAVAAGMWNEIEQAVVDIIDNYPIQPEQISNKEKIAELQNRIGAEIQKAAENRSQVVMERVHSVIEKAVGSEVKRLGSFEDSFYSDITKMQSSFTVSDLNDSESSTVSKVLGASGYLGSALFTGTGIGGALVGLYDGYKKAGIKGALIGGAGSFGGAFLADSIISGVLMSVGVAVSAPIAIVGAVVCGLVGAFAGKKLVNAIFGNRNENVVQEFKDQYCESLKKVINEQKRENSVDSQIKESVFAVFDAISEKIRSETEAVLNNTQATLDELKEGNVKSAILDENERKDLEEMLKTTAAIVDRATRITNKFSQA